MAKDIGSRLKNVEKLDISLNICSTLSSESHVTSLSKIIEEAKIP